MENRRRSLPRMTATLPASAPAVDPTGCTITSGGRLADVAGPPDGAIGSLRPKRRAGGPSGGIATVADRGALRATERALSEAQSQIRAVLDGSPDLIARYDRRLRYTYANGAIARATGWDADRIIGRRVRNVVPDPEVGRMLEAAAQQVLDTGREQTLEYETGTKVGRFWFKTRLLPERDGSGAVTHVLLWARDFTASKHAEDALKTSEASLLAAEVLAKVGNWSFDLRTGVSTWSAQLYRLLAYDVGEVEPGKAALEARLHPDDRDRVLEELASAITGGRPFDLDYRVVLPDGEERWLHSQSTYEVDTQGERSRLHGTLQDITDRKRAGQALERSEELLASVLESSVDGTVALRSVRDRNGTIVDFQCLLANGAVSRILSRPPGSLQGRRVLEEMPGLAETDLFDRYVAVVESRTTFESEQRYVQDGLDLWLHIIAVPLDDGVVVTFADISDRKQAEARLSHDELHDRLTDLPNRALVMDRLHHALDRRQRTNDWVAVFSVDVDRLKAVNDQFGYDVGDEALRVVGSRLRHHARPADTVGRVDGDRFVVMCEGLDEHAADGLARRLLDAFSSPFDIADHEVHLSVSIGVVVTSEGDPDADDLLAAADEARVQAKAGGGGRHEFFDPRLKASARARTELAEELRRGLELGQFTLRYQPIVSLDDLRVTGFEALVRWQHPRRGMMSPADFIPLAEETGFIVPLGRWILEEACRQRSKWAATLGERGDVTIAVNLSARQLAEGDLVGLVKSTVAATGIPARSLCLEVTETGLLDVSTAPETLEALAAAGVRIALDDFGTGYSSVAHLRRFPVHIIKVDRSFVADLDQPDGGPPLVAALAALAGTLGLEVVAEGVENRAQLRAVRALGIDKAQGYLFAKPLTIEAATELLEHGSSAEHGWEAPLTLEDPPVPASTRTGPADLFVTQRMVFDHYPAGALSVFDRELRYLIAGGVGLGAHGSAARGLEGRTVSEALVPRLAEILEPRYRAALAGESATFDVPHLGRTMELRVGPVWDDAGERVIAGVVCTRDVTLERATSIGLVEAQGRFHTAFAHAPIGMAVVGLDGRYHSVNQALCDITGYTEAELCRRTYHDLTHPDDHQISAVHAQGLLDSTPRLNQIEKRYIHAQGRVVWVMLSSSVVRGPSGEPLYQISQIQDISERKDREAVLLWHAERDGLTRLWNRHSFDKELARCHALTVATGEPSSVILLDLDNFKVINDTLGHSAGDEVLRRVGAVLAAGVRSTDVAARYGGDEFAVVLPGTTREVAEALADRLVETIAMERIFIDGRLVTISASAGVADSAGGPDPISVADRALYEAKRARVTV